MKMGNDFLVKIINLKQFTKINKTSLDLINPTTDLVTSL